MRALRALALAALLLLAATLAQAYPDKPVRILLGFPAGGGADTLLRAITPGLSELLGQPIIVENRPGAGGNIAMEALAQAAPDGHTLLMATPGLAINPNLYRNLPFDPLKDFKPVGLVGRVPNVLVVAEDGPFDSVQQLIFYAKGHPGVLNYASSGTGTSLHLAGALFARAAGVELVHVPYSSGAVATNDIMGARVDMMFQVVPSVLGQIRAGKLRALAVTSPERVASLPEVPTIAESGLPGYAATTWNGIVAPAGTPDAIVDQLNAALHTVLALPTLQRRFAATGQEVLVSSPAQFAALLRDEVEKWRTVFREAGISAD